MTGRNSTGQAIRCPYCGQPLPRPLLSRKVRIGLALLLVAYVSLSVILLGLSTPPGLKRACLRQPPALQPEYCRDSRVYNFLKPLTDLPVTQILVGGGLTAGLLIFYWDGLQEMIAGWRGGRSDNGLHHQHCRRCGREWDSPRGG